MVKELDTSCIQRFTAHIDKAMTRATHNGLTIGFEWEIPFRRGEYPPPLNEGVFSREWLRQYGFNGHNDSGGRECGSPIFNNVSTARRFARWLMDAAEEQEELFVMDNSYGNCGIHVHASDSDMNTGSIENSARAVRIWSTANLVMNRLESADFVRVFSGRRDGQSYRGQCLATGWDSFSQTTRSNYSILNSGMVKYNADAARTYAESNSLQQAITTEFRLWGAGKDRLLPAIEFGHSFFRFCRDFVDNVGPGTFDNNVSVRANNIFNESVSISQMSSFIPRMSDYFEFLDRCRGYKNLKADIAAIV